MTSNFRKISSVGSLTGGTKWYLSDDCLLAAKRMMYVVEYRRFYLHDLESVVVWPSRSWRWRLIIPGLLLGLLAASLWRWVDTTSGAVAGGITAAWIGLELALGPTAKCRIRITGAELELPLVKRMRRAHKLLAKVDAAVRATRGAVEQPIAQPTITETPGAPAQTISEASAAGSVAAATQTHAS